MLHGTVGRLCHYRPVRFLEALRAGARSVDVSVTGARLTSTPARSLTAAAEPLMVPPLELGSPWVTSDLTNVVVDLFGSESVPLTREVAMRVPSVSRARNVICPTLGRTPFLLTGTSSPETAAFLDQPDPAQSRFLTMTWTYDDCLFYGVSWWQVTSRYASRKPRTARRILPGGVTREDGGGWKVYGQPVDPSELLRIDGPHEGLLNYASTTLRQASELEAAALKNAKNPIPAVDLHQTQGVTLDKVARQELVKDWAAARAGENGGVAYTSPNIEARVLGQPAELLLSRGRNTAAVDVARHASIPADAVDASVEHASMTYNTVETRMRALVDFGLASYGAAVTARLSMADVTPRGSAVGLDYSAITAVADNDPTTPAPADGPAAAPAGAGSNEGNPA